MRIQHIIAILYIVLTVVHLFDKPIEWWAVGISILIVVMMCGMAHWLDQKEKSHIRTIEWLRMNQHRITKREEFFNDSPFPKAGISKKSNLRSFLVITSLLVVAMDDEVEDDLGSPLINGLIATLWTLLFGWWALPWGPVKTIHAVLINISGGKKTTITERLESQ